VSAILSQLGVVDETTYGTAVAVTKFFEFNSESIAGKYERIESESIRAGQKVLRTDRWIPNAKGAEGDIEIEVLTRGFGFWLKYMLGTVATGTTTDSATTHTATLGPLDGKSFTCQVGRPDITNTVRPYTYAGGKVTEWELKNSVDGVLTCNFTCDFASETIPVASPSGPFALQAFGIPATGADLFPYLNGSLTIGGIEVPISEFSLKASNTLKTDRFFIRSTGGKREQREDGMRTYEWSVTAEFEDLNQISRVASATRAGATAQIVASWTGPTLIGVTTFPALTITLPQARFDEPSTVGIDGAEQPDLELSGMALGPTDGSSPVSIAYRTADATL